MQSLLRVSRGIDAFMERVGQFTGYIVTFTILIGLYNVFARKIGTWIGRNLASNLYVEAQWYLFSIMFFLGFAYVLKRNSHVRVDFLYQNFSPKRRALVNLLGTLLFLFPFCLLAILVTINPVIYSWRLRELSPDPDGLPRYPLKTMIIVAFVLLIIQGISELIKHIAVLTDSVNDDELKELEAYEPVSVD